MRLGVEFAQVEQKTSSCVLDNEVFPRPKDSSLDKEATIFIGLMGTSVKEPDPDRSRWVSLLLDAIWSKRVPNCLFDRLVFSNWTLSS